MREVRVLVLSLIVAVACAQEPESTESVPDVDSHPVHNVDKVVETTDEQKQVENVEHKVEAIVKKLDEKIDRMDESIKAADELIESLKEELDDRDAEKEAESGMDTGSDPCALIVDPDINRECVRQMEAEAQAQSVIDDQAMILLRGSLDPTKPTPVD